MKVLIITEVDLQTGEYEVTFRNKSEPGTAMNLGDIKKAMARVADDFCAENSVESGPKMGLA